MDMEMTAEQLTRMAGILAATSRANSALLSALIATHPEPDVLRHVWQQSKPEWIEDEGELTFFQYGHYKSAFLARLGAISLEIEAAAEKFSGAD